MKRDYVLDTRSRISRSAWRYIISSDQYFYSDRERTVEVKGTREQEEKEKKREYEERGWREKKLSNRSLDSLVSIVGPLRRGNAVTDNGTALRRRSPMWEYCYSNDAAFLSVPLLSSFLLVLVPLPPGKREATWMLVSRSLALVENVGVGIG